LHTFCARRIPLAARLSRDQRGATAIEFAMVAPLFFFLMFVIAETALIFVAEQVMDNAVSDAARLVRTGQVQKAAMSKADFKNEVCARMAVFVSCQSSAFYLDVKSYNSFAEMQMAKPLNADETFQDEGAYMFGGAMQIVVVRAYYQWPTNKIFGSLSLANLANGKRMIGSFAAFRNEPFGPTP
jgi:Flp pilus assembly protein TadG